MALKKSQLYSSLWQSCDELRGGMDASQYKDYVLTLLFVKYVSDKAAADAKAIIEVPKGASFADMIKLKGDKEIGDKINKIIGRLAEANDLKGVIDQADFNDEAKLGSGKEMQDRLSKLIAVFEGLDFRANRAEGDDLLGDAYEYLMRHFATESGKSKGQFYTPAEVSRIMARVIGIERARELREPTVYDPTCGSGSLLIKAADEAATDKLAIYGQEMDVATWALARMNMILHDHPTAEIWRGNTLAAPGFKDKRGGLKTFDFAVANPPFSAKAWSNGLDPEHDEFGRFEYGIPPAKNGDYAFLLHLIKSLKSTGKGAIILPHGVLFRGNKEADIRRNLVQRGLIKGIIGLPANLFYGTGIPACIVVIDKEHAHARTGIFMIDASKGFVKDGNKNRLREQDIHKIVDVFTRQLELPRYSRMVPLAEIASPANDYNLNIPRYIDSSEPEDLHDLDAHLNGGIPNRDLDALAPYWAVFPSLRAVLFKPGSRPGYSEPNIETSKVKPAILDHPEFKAFSKRVATVFDGWRKAHAPLLKGLTVNDLPRKVIHTLGEDLLARFGALPLLDRYDVYQRLMDYWAETMQDDVYLIAADGWREAAKPRAVIDEKEKNIKETPDLTIRRKKYKMDLIPPALIVARYFKDEQAAIDELQAKREAATRELEEYIEEHGGDEGLLADATSDKGKITKAAVKERLKAIGRDAELADERAALETCLQLFEAEAEASKAESEAQAALDEKVLKQYAKLTEAEIKALVVEDKWFAAIRAAVEGEVQRLPQRLAARVKELEERYAQPLPAIELEVETLTAKVEGHLKKMGLTWA
ncbi:MAG: type I restriction-modification system subunit M [Nitrospira sp.]|nr:type I restriction-modification system subunit M [Nitrospira sp.]